jgi:hemoglobin
VWLWGQTVDELFAGERAELAKAHADRVARAFSARLEGRAVSLEEPVGGLLVIAPRGQPRRE